LEKREEERGERESPCEESMEGEKKRKRVFGQKDGNRKQL